MTEIRYRRRGEYLFPELAVPEEPEAHLGKYGSLRQAYLKEMHYGSFISLLTQGKLARHLTEIQEAAQSMRDQIMEEMKRSQNVTEELKEKDQMLWLQKTNSIRQAAEETVMRELIYS